MLMMMLIMMIMMMMLMMMMTSSIIIMEDLPEPAIFASLYVAAAHEGVASVGPPFLASSHGLSLVAPVLGQLMLACCWTQIPGK